MLISSKVQQEPYAPLGKPFLDGHQHRCLTLHVSEINFGPSFQKLLAPRVVLSLKVNEKYIFAFFVFLIDVWSSQGKVHAYFVETLFGRVHQRSHALSVF